MIRALLAVMLGAGQLPAPGSAPTAVPLRTPGPAAEVAGPGAEPAVGPEARTALSNYRAEDLAGFSVLFHRELETDATRRARVRAALLFDLETLSARVPAPALTVLRAVRVVVTPSLEPRPGLSGRGMCFHPSPEWLEQAGLERRRAGTIEVCNADDFLLWRAEQPMMVLHELAHAYHCAIGFNRADVRAAFEAARASGAYERAAHALDGPGRTRRAYAMSNEREYFAELSEAWFGRNDMSPCTRDELADLDPRGAALVERLWSLSAEEIEQARRSADPPPPEPLRTPGAEGAR